MKEEIDYINDLKDIKSMMNQSSRFMSLSGWSGIAIGSIALVAAFVTHFIVFTSPLGWYGSTVKLHFNLALVAALTLIISLLIGYIFTHKKAKKEGTTTWNTQSKQLISNFALPLILGGMIIPLFYIKGYMLLISPMMLVVYGLSLINASKYTLKELKSLGILEIILGLVGIYFPGYGLFLWALGFGVLHIVYGIIMKVKYP